MGWMSYLCLSQKSQVMVETSTPVSMRTLTWMSYTKISASFTLPISSTVVSRPWYWGLVTTPTDWDLVPVPVPVLVKILHSVWVLGKFCCWSPSWSLKVLCFECWGTCVSNAPHPGSYSIAFGFDYSPSWPDFACFQLHCYSTYHFALRALGHCYWLFDCYFSDPSWIPVVRFSLVHFESL